MVVEVGEIALTVTRGGKERLRLPWSAVTRVIWSPRTTTMFVDGGSPARSFLVPGPDAPAPYDLESKPALCHAILAHVAADRVIEVATLVEFAKMPPS